MKSLADPSGRRSSRVLANIPLVIAGVDDQGVRFKTPASTVMVNKQGALIRTRQHLRTGMEIRVIVLDAHKFARARVVREGETEDSAAEREFAIELLRPENIWGVYFPPSDWQEPTSWAEEPLPSIGQGTPTGALRLDSTPGLAPSVSASPAELSPIRIPKEGAEVVIRGMSAVRVPFQERSLLCPVSARKAKVLISPVVDMGEILQLMFPALKRTAKARISGLVVRYRRRGRWEMWVSFIDVRIVLHSPKESGAASAATEESD